MKCQVCEMRSFVIANPDSMNSKTRMGLKDELPFSFRTSPFSLPSKQLPSCLVQLPAQLFWGLQRTEVSSPGYCSLFSQAAPILNGKASNTLRCRVALAAG